MIRHMVSCYSRTEHFFVKAGMRCCVVVLLILRLLLLCFAGKTAGSVIAYTIIFSGDFPSAKNWAPTLPYY